MQELMIQAYSRSSKMFGILFSPQKVLPAPLLAVAMINLFLQHIEQGRLKQGGSKIEALLRNV